MSPLPAVDVVVVGGGVVGCGSAYELAKAGASVAIVEAGEVASVASGASAGGVRQQGRDPRELPIAMRAVARWPSLAEELDADLHYRQDGHLTLAEREEDVPALEARVQAERALGLDIRVVRVDELRVLVPGLSPRIVAGSWCPTDGHAMPILVTKAFADAARRRGATLVERTAVTRIALEGDRVVGVETTRGAIACGAVLLAAGGWSRDLARQVGIDLPLETHAFQMMVTQPMPPILRPVLGCLGRNLSLKQLPSGAFLIGGGWPGSVDLARRFGRVRIGSMAGSALDATAVYPPTRRAPLVRAWTGLEAVSADEVPILGPAPGVEGLTLACGFTGHGFALAPAVGELMAETILTGRVPPLVEPLTLARFHAA